MAGPSGAQVCEKIHNQSQWSAGVDSPEFQPTKSNRPRQYFAKTRFRPKPSTEFEQRVDLQQFGGRHIEAIPNRRPPPLKRHQRRKEPRSQNKSRLQQRGRTRDRHVRVFKSSRRLVHLPFAEQGQRSKRAKQVQPKRCHFFGTLRTKGAQAKNPGLHRQVFEKLFRWNFRHRLIARQSQEKVQYFEQQ